MEEDIRIDRITLEKFVGPFAGEGEFKASLFIVSAKARGIKRLDLAGLSPKERAEKLHKWGQQHRFVAVIEMGDQMFAHTHAEHVERLQGMRELSIEGKKVTVKALTDEEAEQLSAVGEAFEEYVLEEEKGDKAASEAPFISRSEVRQFFAPQKLISDKMQMNFVIRSMQFINGQVILNCLHLISHAQREAAAEKKEDERRADIKDAIRRKEILKGEINTKTVKDIQLEQDSARIDQIRGA